MEKIKELREKTGAGMVDCKKALEEAGGDIALAVEILRKKGIAKAAKRGERETAEGVILLAVNDAHNEGYLLQLNAETDFVSRNEKFRGFGKEVLALIMGHKPADLNALQSLPMGAATVQENLETLSGTIGEKMAIARFAVLSSGGTVAAYSHMDGRIGVLAAVNEKNRTDLAFDVAMQVAASDPKYILPEEVPAEVIDKEKEIYREQLAKEGKPSEMIEKILLGKINKYFEEVCLVKQEFIKDDKKRLGDVLGGAKVERFVRYSL